MNPSTSLRRRRFAAGTLALGTALMAFGYLAPTAQAASVEPVAYEGNPPCADGDNEFKINSQPADGTYDADTPGIEQKGDVPDGFYIEISNVVVVDEAPKSVTFDWAAFVDGDPDPTPFEIDYVLVKFGNGGLRYDYDPAVSSDTGLASTKDSISHVSFCFGEGETTTDGNTDDGTTDDGTTDDGTTDDVSATTGSVDDGGTDDTTVPTVAGITVTKPTVAGAVVARTLPATGSSDSSLMLLGGALILAGAASLVLRREVLTRS
jgi:LPXTG-motif cell wall-anchored protein